MIKLGTSGFSFKDWVGPVYPQGVKPGNMLPYYENVLNFDTVEINFTYYQLPSLRSFEAMAKKTSPGFEFVVKANREMTHDMIDKKTWELTDNKDVFKKFNSSLKVLADHGKLGSVLAQFPVFFFPKKQNVDYIVEFKERMEGIPVVIEFRNKAWLSERTFQSLEEAKLGYCVVDEPDLPRLVPFMPRVTSDLGYFRFHGRNKNWFNVPTSERYNYMYSEEELKEFVPHVQEVAEKTSKTYCFFNNCHNGQAAMNAQMMKKMLGLIDEYRPTQQEMFD
jgi:uncharacterized protein YecE (DUF72 family)